VADAIVEAGGEVLVMPPSPTKNLTGMPYTAEAGEFFRDEDGRPCFQLASMAAAHRREEPDYVAGFVGTLGWRPVATEAVWEAQGDAIRVGADSIVHTWGDGPSARTSCEAYAEVSGRLSARHLHLRFCADPWFHGNTFLAWFQGNGQEVVLVCREAIGDAGWREIDRFAEGAELVGIDRIASLGYATNALQVRDTVLCPEGLSAAVTDVWRALGLTVRPMPLPTLFRRGGGAAVCMTNRLWGVLDTDVPEAVRYSRRRAEFHTLTDSYPDAP
jgi:N-dimethylarginine dimethylaminohydrolase